MEETPNDPIKKYDSRKQSNEYKKVEYITDKPNYRETDIIGLGTAYAEMLAKKKKRRKKCRHSYRHY